MRNYTPAIAAALLTVAAFTPQATAEPVENKETWYVVKISGAPVGFAAEIRRGEAGMIVTQSQTNLSLARMGTPMSMFMMVEEVTDADGMFVKSRMELNASISGMKASAVREGDVIHHRFESGGAVEEQEVPWEGDAVSQWRSDRMVNEWLRTDEPELTFKIYNINDAAFKSMRVVRGEKETETIDGEARTLVSVIEYEGGGDVPVSTTYFGEDYEPFRTVIAQMGMEIVIERVTEEQMASIELEPNFDIIRQSMIRVKGYPDPASNVENVTMRLQFTHPLSKERRFDAPNQKEVQRGDDWVELLLTRDTVNRKRAKDDEQQMFLQPNQYIQCEHPTITALADSIKEASGRSGWELASDIATFVNGYIENKNFEQGFASALEVHNTRAGDCTEHSMLLTALLRAAGIPARPAVGLAYNNGQFIGHMWVEAYADHWRTLDALDLATDPIRVRISVPTDGKAVDERAMVKAYSVVGGMTAEVTGFNLH